MKHAAIFHMRQELKKIPPFFYYLIAFAVTLWTSIILYGQRFYADESYHYKQITRFKDLNFELVPMLTTIPGYHAFMAIFASLLGDSSFRKTRFLAFSVALLSIPLFYLIAKKIHSEQDTALIRTLQLVFFPISFIYVPLVYTDTFSTLLVLTSLLFVLHKRYGIAGLFSIAAIATRQNNFVWLLFIWTYSYVSLYGFSRPSTRILLDHLKKTYVFPLGIAAFGIFVWLNHGIAFGDKTSHQAGFYLGNTYFFLALSGILLFPLLAEHLWKNRPLLVTKKYLLGLSISVLLAASFLFFLPKLHGYNLDARFLRNQILLFTYNSHAWPYVIALFLGIASLFSTKLRSHGWLIYPFTILCLLPSWLIEQRYAIIPFVLILLLRKEFGKKTELFLLGYFIILSLLLYLMIMQTKYFF